ncbi:hypothetical protein LGK95_17050 [Clostridium algoriphilum]|uniref:hypothetical protein n=1 Tax=Clostridium algoriphilum TaxID=198347 RepID=UPI001CF58AEA|nr:hypothetical protein [Clostridium algoriphilum]MCB2295194.1 hypothetical protein [Clostridium algoriphilum]
MDGNLKELSERKDIEEEINEVDPKLNFWGVDFEKINSDSYYEPQIKEETNKNINDKEKVENGDVTVVSEQVKEKANKTLENRIENIRFKYLVGKIVGADLMDSKGIVIASKNSLITEKLINIADKQGKLSELILNMIFPEESE